ncbi:hypothetical protein T01_8746 [Trichinella spiralis]|uniref:Integrase p58-like C-terminal domain-containing protein n=1 Tax=Trichinella spiralis TaxID=6334 RepID=A0A0V1B6S4_TRISP|nr:hypothetical protein T01_8746 [Trichinella spiralis]
MKSDALWRRNLRINPCRHQLHFELGDSLQQNLPAIAYHKGTKLDSEIENLVKTCELCQQSRASPPHAPVHKWESPRIPWIRTLRNDVWAPSATPSGCSVQHELGERNDHQQVRRRVGSPLPKRVCACPKTLLRNRCDIAVYLYCPASKSKSSRKFTTPWTGPFEIVKQVSGLNYRIRSISNPRRTLLVHDNEDKKQVRRDHQSKTKPRIYRPRLVWTEEDHGRDGTSTSNGSSEAAARIEPSTVVSPTGSLSYQVQTEDGQLWRRHIDQLRKRYVTAEENHSAEKIESQKKKARRETVTTETTPEENAAVVTTPREESEAASQSPDAASVGQQRSSTRERRPPQRLKDNELGAVVFHVTSVRAQVGSGVLSLCIASLASLNKTGVRCFVLLCYTFVNERGSYCGQIIIIDLICRHSKNLQSTDSLATRLCPQHSGHPSRIHRRRATLGYCSGPEVVTAATSVHELTARLPRYDLPKYSGDFAEFRAFWDQFDYRVHQRKDLSNAAKLTYLRGCLTGRVAEVISSLSSSNADYEVALKRLREVIRYQIKKLLQAPPKDVSLRTHYDFLRRTVDALTALGKDPRKGGLREGELSAAEITIAISRDCLPTPVRINSWKSRGRIDENPPSPLSPKPNAEAALSDEDSTVQSFSTLPLRISLPCAENHYELQKFQSWDDQCLMRR